MNAIICNHCGKELQSPEWKTIQDGDLEYTVFLCEHCGTGYVVCVTDEALRRHITHYRQMAEKVKEGLQSEDFHRELQQLKNRNRKRSQELYEQHPLTPSLLK